MAHTTTKTIISRVLFAGYILAICMICFINSENVPDIKKTLLGLPVDKVIHFTMFLPFAFLTFLSFDHPAKKGWNSVVFMLVTFAAGCLIALSTEVIQSYLPSRSMDKKDIYSDVLALAISCIFILIIDLTHKK